MPSRLAQIYPGTPKNLRHLAAALRRGDVVAVPTETVYGLAGNALDPRACRKIFLAKGRPADDPLIVHVQSRAQLESIAFTNDAALKLARAFWPGPLTLVLPKRDAIPAIVSSGLSSVAVRMPRHALFRRLLKLTDLPLAAPSANPFGYISPTSAQHVATSLGKKISYILDGGSSRIGVESTIVDLRDPASPKILRPGAITRAQIQTVLGTRVKAFRRTASRGSAIAPGLLKRHYSPRTPCTLHAHLSIVDARRAPDTEAWIFQTRPSGLVGKNIFWLDEKGRPENAARNLFATLRRADAGKFQRIHLERARGEGLADAINDRLQRAAAR
jgi:L-threonylcarbamoyladenylate synthase